MKKQLASIAVTALMGAGTALATSGSASAAPAASGADLGSHVSTRTVVVGAMSQVRGNQHRFVLQTDTAGLTYPRRAAMMTSYFCPTGAKITPTWTSSRCVKRATSYLTYEPSAYRVSSTMRSARFEGEMHTGTKVFDVDLTWFAKDAEPTVSDDGQPGTTLYVHAAKVYGTVAGAQVRSDAREPSFIHRYVR